MTARTDLVFCFLLALAAATAPTSKAEPTDLSGGTLIYHAHPTYELTNFCDLYHSGYGISECADQVNEMTISFPELFVGYIVAAWSEEKEWCETEFGLGEYDPIFAWMIESGPCDPLTVVVNGTADWPHPHEGVTLVATTEPWTGNLQPVYWFAHYVYTYTGAHDQVALTPHPETAFAGFRNCLRPSEEYEAECLGALGINEEGIRCCPHDPQALPPESQTPAGLRVSVPHPMSATGRTTVHFHLSAPAQVRLQVYDAAGRMIDTVVEAPYEAGDHTTHWSGRDHRGVPVNSGVYHLRIVADDQTRAAKLIVAR